MLIFYEREMCCLKLARILNSDLQEFKAKVWKSHCEPVCRIQSISNSGVAKVILERFAYFCNWEPPPKKLDVLTPNLSGWWFQIFFIFIPTWGNDPIWLIFLGWVETTNQWWLQWFLDFCYPLARGSHLTWQKILAETRKSHHLGVTTNL